MKVSNSIILIFSLLVVGCSAEKEENTEVKSETEEKQQTEILAPHLKTLNQAKDMEKTLQDAEAERKKKMDEQEETTDTGNPDEV